MEPIDFCIFFGWLRGKCIIWKISSLQINVNKAKKLFLILLLQQIWLKHLDFNYHISEKQCVGSRIDFWYQETMLCCRIPWAIKEQVDGVWMIRNRVKDLNLSTRIQYRIRLNATLGFYFSKWDFGWGSIKNVTYPGF